jgi:hypothetical protein
MILRYNEEIQKTIGSKTKPEPWMHIAIIKQIRDNGKFDLSLFYAIYVWDTRQVIEERDSRLNYADDATIKSLAKKYAANDSREPLLGGHGKAMAYMINKKFMSVKDDKNANNESGIWFILFNAGDGTKRNKEYGWTAMDKSRGTKSEAIKQGKGAATRLGERKFHEFAIGSPYVTDSIDAFKKACEQVGLRPNLSEYE